MEEEARKNKEDIVKNKLGNQDVDLKDLPDEELDKLISKEDKEKVIQNALGAKDLKVDNLPDDQVDALFNKLNKDEGSSLSESTKEEYQNKEEILEALCSKFRLKKKEARSIYSRENFKKKNRGIIDTLYEAFSKGAFKDVQGFSIAEDDERDSFKKKEVPEENFENIPTEESLQDQEGEKIKGSEIDIPNLQYANKKEAKTFPDPINL